MDAPATVLAATDAIELFGALLLASSFAWRPSDREYGLAGLFCFAAAGHATAALAWEASHDRAGAAGLLAVRVGTVALLAALPLVLHFALLYSRASPPEWRAVFLVYFAAAVLAVAAMVHPPLPEGSPVARNPDGVGAGVAVLLAALVAATAVLVLVARAYRGGKRGALAVLLGAAAWFASALNDLGARLRVLSSMHLTDLGFAAFVIGLATTPAASYAAVAQELERRSGELRTRTRELLRSYEDLRAAQEELVKKEQLAVVGELAAVIAHEVRNPLAIIANAGAGLRKQAISREDHDTLLAILDEETSRLNRLVTDLLRYARPVNVQRSHLPLAELLERALALANDKSKIRSELRVDAGEGRIWGDANLLRQVFDNLIANAVQAMGSEGSLTVSIRSLTEDGVPGLAVEITDTGEGMDTQVRSRALDPFFTTRPSGTGLGLAIVDRIVDAHGGRLEIDSCAGEGTTVTVFLPRGAATEPPSPRSRRPGTTADPGGVP